MAVSVAWLSDEAIEANTIQLIAAAGHELGQIVEPPIPVEDILQFHLGLSLDFGDLQKKLGHADILGATWVTKKEVIINQSLDPVNRPELLGRYLYTVGHEIGHWQLHRTVLDPNPGQGLLFGDINIEPSVVCRTGQATERIERQADYFSAYLLMPTQMVLDAWHKLGHSQPLASEIIELQYREAMGSGQSAVDVTVKALDWAAKDLAQIFQTSATAMRIRLERMGLFNRKQQERLIAIESI